MIYQVSMPYFDIYFKNYLKTIFSFKSLDLSFISFIIKVVFFFMRNKQIYYNNIFKILFSYLVTAGSL